MRDTGSQASLAGWGLVAGFAAARAEGNLESGVEHARFERSDVQRRSVMLRALLFFTYR